MAQVKFHKFVAALPAELEANAIYYVRAGAGFDTYVTNSSGTVVAYPLNVGGAGQGFFRTEPITATATGQTVFTVPGGYTPGAIIVSLNGATLPPADYTATDGATVVLASGDGIVAGSVLLVHVLSAFEVANALPLGGTAADSSKLGGQLPSYYAAASTVPAGANLLINGDFSINQRAFGGGALAAGAYGHDRWGAYNGGANYSVASGVVSLVSGELCQAIESPGLAGETVVFSVENPSAALTVRVGNAGTYASGVVQAGAGRRSVSLTVPATTTGHVKVRISGAGSFEKAKLEIGTAVTPWRNAAPGEGFLLASRYFYRLAGAEGANCSFIAGGSANNSLVMKAPLPRRMRASPAVVSNLAAANYVAGNPNSNQWTLAAAGVNYSSFSGTPNLLFEGGTQVCTLYLFGATVSPVPNQLSLGSSMRVDMDAELSCTD